MSIGGISNRHSIAAVGVERKPPQIPTKASLCTFCMNLLFRDFTNPLSNLFFRDLTRLFLYCTVEIPTKSIQGELSPCIIPKTHFWVTWGLLRHLWVSGQNILVKYRSFNSLSNTNSLMYYSQNTFLGHSRVLGSHSGQAVKIFW